MGTFGGPRPIVSDGLVFTLDAANIKSYPGSGTTVTDLINDNDGTFQNSPTFISSENQGVFSFDGQEDHIILAPIHGGNDDNNNYAWTADNSVGSNTFCYEVWFKGTDTVGEIISKPWNGSGRYNFRADDGRFYLLAGNGGAPEDSDSTSTLNFDSSIADGNWHQLVIWANSTQMGYYIDGNNSSDSKNHNLTGGISNAGNSRLPLILMTLYAYGDGSSTWPQPTHAIEGKVGIFRKYSKVLSASEVLQNYNGTKPRFGL